MDSTPVPQIYYDLRRAGLKDGDLLYVVTQRGVSKHKFCEVTPQASIRNEMGFVISTAYESLSYIGKLLMEGDSKPVPVFIPRSTLW